MCGITGYYSPSMYELRVDKIVEMTELIKHRGPDDEGYVFINTKDNMVVDAYGIDSPCEIKEKLKDVKSLGNVRHNLAFGHRRYAIIDLTPGGHQPFWNEDRSVCISFNGEIYNYIEIKNELEGKGYKFATTSDTEVLINAYMEWGENCFEKFNGTWALSLYDARYKKLLLSRDRIGKSPLYYTIRDNVLYWSSEIKSLLAVCGMDAFSVNVQAIHDFINYGLRDIDNSTFWNEIRTLRAASYAQIDIGNGSGPGSSSGSGSLNFQEHVYWTIPKERSKISDISFDDAREKLRNLLVDAIDIRLRSDIAVGFALSGGMDSSSMLALYTNLGKELEKESEKTIEEKREKRKKRTVSFTVKFPQKESNEEHFAHMVADRCGKENVDYRVIEPLFSDFWKDINDYVWLIEEPFHSPNVYVEQLLQRRLKEEGFGVMINGNGGDELFAGYEYMYFPLYLKYLLNRDKKSFIRESFSWIDKNLKALDLVVYSIFSLNPTVKNCAKGFIKRFITKDGLKDTSFLQNLDGAKKRCIPDNFNDLMIGNMGQWLMNYWLRVGNKTYFAVPMETRSPFLDYRLVEFAFRLPPEYLIHNGWHKYILRKSVEDLLPKDVVWRKNKMGFPFPIGEWLESSKHIIEKNLKGVNCPYVNIEHLFENYDDMVKSDPNLLWRYVSLLFWWKRVILKEPIVSN